MKPEALRIGQRVRHPQYGLGVVKSIAETIADIQFDDGKRAVDPQASGIEAAEPRAAVSGLDVPLDQFVDQIVGRVVDRLGFEKPDAVVAQLGARWRGGKLVLKPTDPSLQPKEVELDVFFHKIVGVRNHLRVLEEKINGHPALTDADKVELQQYITRSYGSLTTFNLLFKDKDDQFSSKGE